SARKVVARRVRVSRVVGTAATVPAATAAPTAPGSPRASDLDVMPLPYVPSVARGLASRGRPSSHGGRPAARREPVPQPRRRPLAEGHQQVELLQRLLEGALGPLHWVLAEERLHLAPPLG